MIWLIGAGPMAIEHAKVLTALKRDVRVFGRSERSAHTFTESTGLPVQLGGTEQIGVSETHQVPDAAIIAVNPENLAEVTSHVLRCGVKRILLEKPGALCYDDIQALRTHADRSGAEILIAYNRRFFESTRRAREIIQSDGGVLSFNFEITEWAHVIGSLDKPQEVLAAWFLANTSHVVDLAWFLGGLPVRIHSYHSPGQA